MKAAVQTSKETRFIELVKEVELHFGNDYKLIVTETDEKVDIVLHYDDGDVLTLESIITAHKVDSEA